MGEPQSHCLQSDRTSWGLRSKMIQCGGAWRFVDSTQLRVHGRLAASVEPISFNNWLDPLSYFLLLSSGVSCLKRGALWCLVNRMEVSADAPLCPSLQSCVTPCVTRLSLLWEHETDVITCSNLILDLQCKMPASERPRVNSL